MRAWRRGQARFLPLQAALFLLAILAGTPCSRIAADDGEVDLTLSEGAVILDPGHGGEDLGARVAGKNEKDICLAVARKLQVVLEKSLQTPVFMTRDTDVNVPLDARVERSLDLNGKVVVSLHVNRVANKRLHGITVYSYGYSPYQFPRRHPHLKLLPAPPAEQVRASGMLAHDVVRSLQLSGFSSVDADRAGYYVLRNPKLPSILIEMGFLSNSGERAKLTSPAYQERLAKAIERGIGTYLTREPAASEPAQVVAWRGVPTAR